MLSKENLLKNIILNSPVGAWHSAIEAHFTKGKADVKIFLSPCRKCIVKPICKQHKQCDQYQNWFFKKTFCKHDWKTSRLLMNLPTSLMEECTKCGNIR
jgi:hypothetical protein